MKQELADECDYEREAGFINQFAEHLREDSRFRVPWVWEGSSKDVLVMEHIDGVGIGAAMSTLSQADRDEVRF